MVSVMNEYVNKIHLTAGDVTKGILNAALQDIDDIDRSNILVKSNRYIVDIKLKEYSVERAVAIMNLFMERTRYHYSAYFIRFNEGNMVRYRYATCKEDREGFYCDVIIAQESYKKMSCHLCNALEYTLYKRQLILYGY